MHEEAYLAKIYLLGTLPCGKCKHFIEDGSIDYEHSSACEKIRDGNMDTKTFVEVFKSKNCPHFAYINKDNTKE